MEYALSFDIFSERDPVTLAEDERYDMTEDLSDSEFDAYLEDYEETIYVHERDRCSLNRSMESMSLDSSLEHFSVAELSKRQYFQEDAFLDSDGGLDNGIISDHTDSTIMYCNSLDDTTNSNVEIEFVLSQPEARRAKTPSTKAKVATSEEKAIIPTTPPTPARVVSYKRLSSSAVDRQQPADTVPDPSNAEPTRRLSSNLAHDTRENPRFLQRANTTASSTFKEHVRRLFEHHVQIGLPPWALILALWKNVDRFISYIPDYIQKALILGQSNNELLETFMQNRDVDLDTHSVAGVYIWFIPHAEKCKTFVYVGMTSDAFEERWDEHTKSLAIVPIHQRVVNWYYKLRSIKSIREMSCEQLKRSFFVIAPFERSKSGKTDNDMMLLETFCILLFNAFTAFDTGGLNTRFIDPDDKYELDDWIEEQINGDKERLLGEINVQPSDPWYPLGKGKRQSSPEEERQKKQEHRKRARERHVEDYARKKAIRRKNARRRIERRGDPTNKNPKCPVCKGLLTIDQSRPRANYRALTYLCRGKQSCRRRWAQNKGPGHPNQLTYIGKQDPTVYGVCTECPIGKLMDLQERQHSEGLVQTTRCGFCWCSYYKEGEEWRITQRNYNRLEYVTKQLEENENYEDLDDFEGAEDYEEKDAYEDEEDEAHDDEEVEDEEEDDDEGNEGENEDNESNDDVIFLGCTSKKI